MATHRYPKIYVPQMCIDCHCLYSGELIKVFQELSELFFVEHLKLKALLCLISFNLEDYPIKNTSKNKTQK